MIDKQALMDDIEVAAIWYIRKLDDMQDSVAYALRQAQLGNPASESITKSAEALTKAEGRLKKALSDAKEFGLYKAEAEKATLKGMER